MTSPTAWYLTKAERRFRDAATGLVHVPIEYHAVEEAFESRFDRMNVLAITAPVGLGALLVRERKLSPYFRAVRSARETADEIAFSTRLKAVQGDVESEALLDASEWMSNEDLSTLGALGEEMRTLRVEVASAERTMPDELKTVLQELDSIDENIVYQLRIRSIEAPMPGWAQLLWPTSASPDTLPVHVAIDVASRTIEEVRVVRRAIGFSDPYSPLPAEIRSPPWARALAGELKDRVRLTAGIVGVNPPTLTPRGFGMSG